MNKSVVVLGASGGIGEAIVKEFVKSGYDIYATYNNGSLEELEDFCKNKKVSFTKYKLNVEDYENVHQIFEDVFKKAEFLEISSIFLLYMVYMVVVVKRCIQHQKQV